MALCCEVCEPGSVEIEYRVCHYEECPHALFGHRREGDRQIQALDEELINTWGHDPRVQRLCTIPGIGPFIAIVLVLELAEQAGDPQLLFPCYDGLAALHLEMGNDASADEYMQKAQDLCERTGLDPDSLVVLPFLE